jgi:hypothetical protein
LSFDEKKIKKENYHAGEHYKISRYQKRSYKADEIKNVKFTEQTTSTFYPKKSFEFSCKTTHTQKILLLSLKQILNEKFYELFMTIICFYGNFAREFNTKLFHSDDNRVEKKMRERKN